MINKEYNQVFQFGEVSYNGKQKSNLVELEVILKIKDNKAIFSAMGTLWNERHSDCIMGGQCIDSIYGDFRRELANRKQYESIMALWEKWHLNDMHAGCEHQDAAKWQDVFIDDSKPKTQDNMAICWCLTSYPQRLHNATRQLQNKGYI